jgi:molecular chaperone GrpE
MTSSPKIQDADDKPADASAMPQEPAATLASEASPESQLQQEIDRLTEENHRLRDQCVRAVAETDNVRKRSQRDIAEASRYAISNFAKDMAGVLENLKRASDTIPAEARKTDVLLNKLGEGVDLTTQELLAIFKRYDIHRIDPIDQKFDHNLHEAVVQIPRDDVPPGTIVQVMQAGYTIGDRLLKPAMVAVSKAGDSPKTVDEVV